MKLLETLSKAEIIDRVLVGEKYFFEILVRRNNPYLYKIGRSYDFSHDDVMDIMQDTYIDAYKNLSGFEKRANFRTWIFRIMLNNCYRKRNKSSFKKEIMQEINDRSKPMFMEQINHVGEIVQNRELGSIIEGALDKIPIEYRMVFTLREMNGLSVSDTASILDITEGNVRVRLNRAKAMLRDALERSYTSNELFEFHLVYCDEMVERVMDKIFSL